MALIIFSAGNVIDSAEVNDNFEQVAGRVYDNVAGEAINGDTNGPQPVYEQCDTYFGTSQIVQPNTDDGETVDNTQWTGQSFTIAGFDFLTKFRFHITGFQNSVTPAQQIIMEFYAADAGSLPTGPLLASQTITYGDLFNSLPVDLRTVDKNVFIDFDIQLPVTDTNEYVVTIGSDLGGNITLANEDPGTYAGGTRINSNDSGRTWATAAEDLQFEVYGTTEKTSGEVYISKDIDADQNQLLGFVTEDVVASDPVTVLTEGVIDGFTALTPCTDYYIDAAGALTTAITSIYAGYAIDATHLDTSRQRVNYNFIDITDVTDAFGAICTVPGVFHFQFQTDAGDSGSYAIYKNQKIIDYVTRSGGNGSLTKNNSYIPVKRGDIITVLETASGPNTIEISGINQSTNL